jgi:secreted trypsin-like serine protease
MKIKDFWNIFRCGSYPGLYTEVARYTSWISSWVDTIETEESLD